ncbi:MAG: thiopurine S-methyltransferase [Pseudomonadota bacterium]
MDESFWQARWRKNKIAFHEPQAHEFLREHFTALDLSKGATVFVPLCGKTLDIDWLLAKCLHVIGIEFNQSAIEEVFRRLNLTPKISQHGKLIKYEAGELALFQGDFFELSADQLGKVHAIYDRAALVALPEETRQRYAQHLADIAGAAPQLVISYSYDQTQTEGPPFSVPTPVLRKLYLDHYSCLSLDRRQIEGPLATRCSGEESILLLVPRQPNLANGIRDKFRV